MNFVYFIYKINQKLKLIILYCTYVFKKVYYCSCYNCNGNTFVCKGSFFNTKIILSGRNNTLLIEKGAKLYNVNIFISGCNNKLVIHENVNFKESGRIILEDENNLLEINRNTDFVDCFFAIRDYGKSRVIIGEDCMFSAKITVRNSDAHSIIDSFGRRINPSRDVIIGNHVWVGYGATLLKGTKIGDNSIIASQAVIAGCYPSCCIVAGNPGKIIKADVSWERSLFKV